jgi:error-prone DNA polymerase
MPYVELHCKTNFSFLEGASFPDELIHRAAHLGLSALGITDRNSLCGVVQAHQAAKEAKFKLLIGAEITPEDGPSILLYPKNRAAYARLSRLITVGRRRAEKGECSLQIKDVLEHAKDQFGIVLPVVSNTGRNARISKSVDLYKEAFDKRLYLGSELHLTGNDERAPRCN